ncbi:MAG: hypothetical protein M3O33_13820, partial [Cyanobacteriota bacterium]|nr:hypothetical protein [Cyanobacteriota bacterium]
IPSAWAWIERNAPTKPIDSRKTRAARKARFLGYVFTPFNLIKFILNTASTASYLVCYKQNFR